MRRDDGGYTSGDMMGAFRRLLHEGNIRQIIVRDETGKTVIQLSLTLVVILVVLFPPLILLGLLAVVAGRYTIVMENTERSGS